jgi:osmoprotectant transport system substrate-binding protein
VASSRVIRGLAVVGVALSLVACSAGADRPASVNVLHDDAITVASFDFPESDLLAQIYGQALERGGYPVHFVSRLGPREFVDPALQRGLVELVPEYAGTALQFASTGRVRPTAGTAANHRRLADQLAGSPVVALAPSPAEDSNVIVTTREVAARHRLRTVSDLADVAPRLVFGGPPECPIRPFCLQGLRRTYGLHFGRVLALDAGGPLTHQVLAAGEADVALLFSTDSRITDEGLVILRDDRHLQPAENITPLIRRELVDRWGDDLTDLIDGVSGQLTTEELRRLNGGLTDEPGSAATTAARWLAKEHVP